MTSNYFQDFGTVGNVMGKVIIQSTSTDGSTDDIISWLYYLKEDIEINNLFDNYEVKNLGLRLSNKHSLSVLINEIKIDDRDVSWYRRGELMSSYHVDQNDKGIRQKIYDETVKPIFDFLNTGLASNKINKFSDNYLDKLHVLYKATLYDIKIPNVLVTGDSNELNKFLKKNKRVITKPIKNPFINTHIENYQIKFSTQSKLLTIDDISKEYYKFMPSFFQKYIEKKYEIRTFYLRGIFRSMAIFSQQNEKTKIDFRNYDHVRPNRCVPYNLPKGLEKKLHKLMISLKIDCGSFDIICTSKNKYIFLEVNPIGQFQWLSKNCNYYIERLISKKIING